MNRDEKRMEKVRRKSVRDSDPLGRRLAGCSFLKLTEARLRCKSDAGVPSVRTGRLAI